jgi:outer membrane protein assembly factor BamD
MIASLHGNRSSLPLLLVLNILIVITLSGCGAFEGMFSKVTFGEDEEVLTGSPELLIKEGMEYYSVGDYEKAIRSFEKILDEYPFSKEAMLAELKAADAHYYNKSYLEAKFLYQAFEERHPTNEAIPYVLFQIGMCDFTRSDRIDRDVSGAQDAIKSFSRLVRTFPNSPYTKEAVARIQAAREFLVNHEYYVAVFYVRSEKYDQAIHRLKYILTVYPDSSISPKAKALLDKLENGEPPRWGINKWLPDLSMPNWGLWESDTEQDTSEESGAEMVPKEEIIE